MKWPLWFASFVVFVVGHMLNQTRKTFALWKLVYCVVGRAFFPWLAQLQSRLVRESACMCFAESARMPFPTTFVAYEPNWNGLQLLSPNRSVWWCASALRSRTRGTGTAAARSIRLHAESGICKLRRQRRCFYAERTPLSVHMRV